MELGGGGRLTPRRRRAGSVGSPPLPTGRAGHHVFSSRRLQGSPAGHCPGGHVKSIRKVSGGPARGRSGGRRFLPSPPRAGRNQRAARTRGETRTGGTVPGARRVRSRCPGGGAADATSEPGCGMSRQCPDDARGGAVPRRGHRRAWTSNDWNPPGRVAGSLGSAGGAPPGATRGREPARESVRGDRLAAPRVRARRVRLRRARARRSPSSVRRAREPFD